MHTIYKTDTKGKLRYITYSTQGDMLLQESGLIGGKSTTATRTCKAKNVGKSNETTPAEQAVLEMEAKLRGKLSGEYFRTIEEAENTEVIGPMLAKDYFKHTISINFSNGIFMQPKLDGMRCLAIIRGDKVTLQSRDYKEITTMQHIVDQLEALKLGNCILDGELYNSALGPFQEQMKACKKVRPETLLINYNMYDMVSDHPFDDRSWELSRIFKDVPSTSNNIRLVPTVYSNLELVHKPAYYIRQEYTNKIKTFYKKCMSKGYEGVMIRHGDKSYGMNKRCDSLLKYKKFIDESFLIEDIVPNEAHPEQGTAVCSITNEFGEKAIFKCGMKMSHADRKEMLSNKQDYIGKIAEVRFFEYTTSVVPVPRFPIMHGVRVDKHEPDSVTV